MRSARQHVMKTIERDPHSALPMALAKLILSLHHQSNLPGLSDALNRIRIDVPSQRFACFVTSVGRTLSCPFKRD